MFSVRAVYVLSPLHLPRNLSLQDWCLARDVYPRPRMAVFLFDGAHEN